MGVCVSYNWISYIRSFFNVYEMCQRIIKITYKLGRGILFKEDNHDLTFINAILVAITIVFLDNSYVLSKDCKSLIKINTKLIL